MDANTCLVRNTSGTRHNFATAPAIQLSSDEWVLTTAGFNFFKVLNKARQEEKRFKRTTKPFAFILLDIDYFKKVNDTHGHDWGDMVLKGVAQGLKKSLRNQDVVARWGGEEFVCLLPETELSGAGNVAEKMRLAIEATGHECGKNSVSVTITLGVYIYNGSCSIEECIRRADEALYQGKKQGRNQVVVPTG